MSLLLCHVPTELAHEVWPKISNLIAMAVKRGLGSHAVIRDMVFDGRALMWIATEGKFTIPACAITSIVLEERRKVCEIVACAGRGMREWLPLLSGLEKYARSEKCDAMRLLGRKGWQRVLKDYHSKHIILEKDL